MESEQFDKALVKMLEGSSIEAVGARDNILFARQHNLVYVYVDEGVETVEIRGATHGTCEFSNCEQIFFLNGTLLVFWEDIFAPGAIAEEFCDLLSHHGMEPVLHEIVPDKDEGAWFFKTYLPHTTFKVFRDGELDGTGMIIDKGDLMHLIRRGKGTEADVTGGESV